MTILIHGFRSNGESKKAKLFREYFKSINQAFIAPSLSYIPELAIKTLEELIESYSGDVHLVGSSLGGFYATYLADKYNLNAVLINPAIFPCKTLIKDLGNTKSFYDDSYFTWTQSHIDTLKNYEVNKPKHSSFMLLLQKGDTVLDYKEAQAKFNNSTLIIEDAGSHSFEGIENHFESIRENFTLLS